VLPIKLFFPSLPFNRRRLVCVPFFQQQQQQHETHISFTQFSACFSFKLKNLSLSLSPPEFNYLLTKAR